MRRVTPVRVRAGVFHLEIAESLRLELDSSNGGRVPILTRRAAMNKYFVLIAIVSALALTGCGASSNSSGGSAFCSTHDCIGNFDNGNGYVVECADGTWSHSGGIQGACSDHGGEL
jgi:hypothetical protein